MTSLTNLKQIESTNIVLITTIGVFLLSSCTASTLPAQTVPAQPVPVNDSFSVCVDVYGKVFGDISPNSTAYLHTTDTVEFDDVMKTVEGNDSIQTTTVNKSKEFMFPCLDYGNFAIMIPTSSYNSSVGYPLPHEICTENLSIEIAFQGGDYRYAVGAFSIIDNNQSLPCEKAVQSE